MIELVTDAYDPVRPFSGVFIWGVLALGILVILICIAAKGNVKNDDNRTDTLVSTAVATPFLVIILSVVYFAHTDTFSFPVLKEDLEAVGFEQVNMVTGDDSRTVENRFTAVQKRTFVECVITEEVVEGTYQVFCIPQK